MRSRKIPAEIGGYVDRQIWVVDTERGISGFRWFSIATGDYEIDQVFPWNERPSVLKGAK